MKFISVRSTLIFIVCAGIAISSPAQSGAALPLPPDSVRERVASRTQIQLRLTLDKAIYSAQNHSIAAMVAKYTFLSSYWSFRSYQASRLPSLNLSGEVLSFDRSLRLLQDYDTGEMRYLENYNLQNTLGLAIQQNITLTGGTLRLYSSLNRLDQFAPKESKSYYSQPITLSYTQPLFAYNSFRWNKKIAPKEYELAKRTYIEAMEDITVQAVSYYFSLLLSKTRHTIAVKNYGNTKSLYSIAEERLKLGSITNDELLQLQLRMLNDSLAINDTALAVREQRMRFNSYLRYSENVDIDPVLDDRIPAIEVDYATVLDKALENSSFNASNQLRTLNAEAGIAKAKGRTGRYGYDKCPVRIVPDRRGVPDGLFEPARPGGHRTPVFHPAFRLGHGQGARPYGQGAGRHGTQPDRAGRNRLPAHNLYAHRTIP